MSEEIWKAIEGWNGKYEISSTGIVRTRYRYGHLKDEYYYPIAHFTKTGYKVHLYGPDGHIEDRSIHLLMAEAFLENPNGYSLVRHKDGNLKNNVLENIEWWGGIQDCDYNNSFSKEELESETWKDIAGTDGKYKVSSLGRVICMRYHNADRIKMMRPHMNRKGYLLTSIVYKNGVRKDRALHILVAEAFIDNPDPEHFTMVDHIDENKQNNRVGNLQWLDNRTNSIRGTAITRMTKNIKPITDSFRKPILQYDLKGNFIAEYPYMTMASEKTGVNIQTIRRSATGNPTKNSRFIWRYKDRDIIPAHPPIPHAPARNSRPVIQMTQDGTIINTYGSARDAVKALNRPIHSRQISDCCKGRCKSAYGFVWRYADEQETERLKSVASA